VKTARIALIAFAMYFAIGCSKDRGQVLIFDSQRPSVIADGRSVLRLRVFASGRIQPHARDLAVRHADQQHGTAEIHDSPLTLVYRPGVLPGAVRATVSGNGVRPASVTITSVPDYTDSFGDGTPDFLRLDSVTDRRAFRQWFVLIAERQAFVARLPVEINDCAALLRYAYAEAMRRHDSAWASSRDFGQNALPSDLAKYEYPYTPLGPRLFRIREGRFLPSDLTDGTFAEFADARTLIVTNTHLVSRDVARAQPGDLLFYRQFGQHSPFHSMVFLGHSQFGPGDDWVVYHTGRDGTWAGEIRRVSLSSLLRHQTPAGARYPATPTSSAFIGGTFCERYTDACTHCSRPDPCVSEPPRAGARQEGVLLCHHQQDVPPERKADHPALRA
jgi:uncharacterized protein YfaT (DUF1175 family)